MRSTKLPALRSELPVRRWTDSPWRALLLFAILAWLWFFLCRQLSYEWSANEQYSYGWFVPVFAAFLFWLRFEDGGKVESVNAKVENRGSASPSKFLLFTFYFLLLAALLPLRLFEVANPDWRPLSWVHALIVVGYSLFVIGYWFRPAGSPSDEAGSPPDESVRLADWKPDFRFNWIAVRHFAFPVCFILVAVPWVTPIETPIVQGLMRLVASIATETLTLFGIPAQLEGSLIRVANGVVGVSEACSGVRSLQTSLMIGLLFGELKRLSLGWRVALVAAALAIAFIANCGRAFFLVWIAATQNLAAVERWHDLAGYAIVGLVFLGTVAIASAFATKKVESEKAKVENEEGRNGRDQGRRLIRKAGTQEKNAEARLDDTLGRRRKESEKARVENEEGRNAEAVSAIPRSALKARPRLWLRYGRVSHFSPYFLLSTLAFLLLSEASVSAWYRWHERNFVSTTSWTVRWPESAPGFHELPINDNVKSTLRYDAGREGAWQGALTNPPNEQTTPANLTMFFFRWEPGSASILRARAHRPDICLPNTGWHMTHDDGVRSYQVSPGFSLPFRHFRFARDVGNGRQVFAQAFFCQREDRVPAGGPDRFDATAGHTGNWMRGDRVRVVREGLRNQGQQVMELVMMTPRPLSSNEAEGEFGRLVSGLVVQNAEKLRN